MNPAVSVLLWTVYLLSLYLAVFWLLALLRGRDVFDERPKGQLRQLPLVTIAIPAHNEEANIAATIKAALNLDWPRSKLEIIAVDHGSVDRTAKIMQSFSHSIKVLSVPRLPEQRKGAPLNAALRAARGELFVCLDADSIPERTALRKMVPHFQDRRVACVLPLMKVRRPRNFWQKVQWTEYLVNMFYKKLMGSLDAIHVAPGPFSVYRTSALRAVGGFDSANLTEDLEVTYRLQKAHYKIVQLLGVKVATKTPRGFAALYAQRKRWFKGALLSTLRHREMLLNRAYGDFGLVALPTVLLSAFLSLTLLATTAYYSLRPHIDFLRHISLVDFDFLTFIRNLSLNLHALDLNWVLLFSSAVMLAISITIVLLTRSRTRHRLMVGRAWHAFAFFFVYYYLIMGLAWLGVAVDLLLRRMRW